MLALPARLFSRIDGQDSFRGGGGADESQDCERRLARHTLPKA
jgi:hypothetical protein